MNIEDRKSSRRKFLRGVGVTLAAAVGAAAYPSLAHASINCCPNESLCPPGNCPGQHNIFCDCSQAPGTNSYCICQSSSNCYSGPC